MRKVMLMSIEEESNLPKLVMPDPPIIGQHYKYVNAEGRVFCVTKLLATGYIEMIPIVLES